MASSAHRADWLRARSQGITATEVAKLSTPRSVQTVAREKLEGSRFSGNVYTEYGREREPAIAAWVADHYSISPSNDLYHAESELRHLATPDGLRADTHELVLAEIKTSTKSLANVPRPYLRQIWWQQYVLGATRTLFVWEQHENFRPISEPQVQWIERDETQIAHLIRLANAVLEQVAEREWAVERAQAQAS